MTEVYVKVEPDSDKFKIEMAAIPKIFLKSEAENGKANSELIRNLKEITGQNTGIISGHKSRRKKLKTELSKQKFREKLRDY